jgi:wobble nucleotide-excising tRNase
MYQRLRADELVKQPRKERRIYFMANNKIDRINKEIAKTREKITEYQNKLKGLEAQKTEAENLEIVQLVRSMRLTPQELNAMLSGGGIPGMTAAPAEENEQEENADEE